MGERSRGADACLSFVRGRRNLADTYERCWILAVQCCRRGGLLNAEVFFDSLSVWALFDRSIGVALSMGTPHMFEKLPSELR